MANWHLLKFFMDKTYRRKLLKLAIGAPLAFSVALVLDIDPSLSFLGPLMVLNTIWLFPDPIGLKRVLIVKFLSLIISMCFAAAFMAGLWGINSIVLFLFILLTGWVIQTWKPSTVSLGLLSPGFYLPTSVLTSSAPYTTAVYMSLLLAITLGLGWSIDRLFWPIFAQQGIERQVSKTFRIFEEFSDRAFQHPNRSKDGSYGSLEALRERADASIRATNKALKTAGMTGSLAPSDRETWAQAIALQARLLAHLLAISGLLQENRENPLLHELAPELSALGDRLSAIFAELSVAIVSKHPEIQLRSPNIDFQNWQSRLTGMRVTGKTRSFDLASRLAVGAIEHRLQGLVTDISKSLAWLETRRSALLANLPLALETAQ